jgi:PAS domain S-box-containing protein
MDNSESQKMLFPPGEHGPEALLSSILDAVPDAVLGIRERVIVFANHAVEAVFGWKSEELIGQSTRVLYRSDEDYEEIGRRFYPLLEERRTFAAQFPCRHRNGKDIACEVSVSRIGDDLREKMIVATYQDVTERLETESQLSRVNENLDLQVRERTAELREANTKLEAEIERGRIDGERLQRLEEEKALILDTMSELVIYVDRDLKINWSNNAVHEAFNLTAGSSFGQYCYRALHKRNKPCKTCLVRIALEMGQPQELADFSSYGRRWRIRVYPVFNEKKELLGAVEIVTDVTKRRHAEEALRDREEKFRAIFTQAVNLLGLVDLKGRQVEVNDASAAFVGLEPSQLIGNLFWENPWWSHSVKEQQAIRESVRRGVKGEISVFETTCRDNAGKIHYVDYSLKPIRDDRGCVKMLLAEGRDVTDRKEMEEIIRESENNYRTIFEAVNDGIFSLGLKTGEILDANLKGLEIFGYRAKGEMQGLTFDTFMINEPPYTLDDALIYIRKVVTEGPQIFIWPGKRKDGEPVWMEVSLKRASLKKQDCIIAVVRDISERKREEEEKQKLEIQIQQAMKMEAIGTLAGGIAHDFNNLLMGIQGYTSLMLLNAAPGQTCYDRLKSIEQQVLSGADLTKQLLGFARRGRYEVKTTDMNDLVQRTASLFGRTKKEIRIQGKYAEGLWSVDVDQGQIEQALLNLFINAWQAMPGGGMLYLETSNVVLDENYVKPYEIQVGPYAKLSVTDTGVGMDEKTRLRIFEPFFTTKEMRRGTGLGLASTYGIVKGHGGIINVYSERGHGTTFNIYLPASNEGVLFEEQGVGEIKSGQETILLVDDENIIIEVTQEILEELGYQVMIAQNGEEALEIYKQNKDKIDLVILDMIMPGMGGGDVYDRMKETNPEVEVILSSGYSINGEAMEIMERGVRSFLQKPFTVTDLSRRIREVLDKKLP